jgi:hypothetical protein
MNDLEADLLIAKAEIATLKKGNMFTVPEDYVKVVRCRDCVSGEPEPTFDGDVVYKCKKHSKYERFYGHDYCSSGKRRKDDG